MAGGGSSGCVTHEHFRPGALELEGRWRGGQHVEQFRRVFGAASLQIAGVLAAEQHMLVVALDALGVGEAQQIHRLGAELEFADGIARAQHAIDGRQIVEHAFQGAGVGVNIRHEGDLQNTPSAATR